MISQIQYIPFRIFFYMRSQKTFDLFRSNSPTIPKSFLCRITSHLCLVFFKFYIHSRNVPFLSYQNIHQFQIHSRNLLAQHNRSVHMRITITISLISCTYPNNQTFITITITLFKQIYTLHEELLVLNMLIRNRYENNIAHFS